MRTKLRLLIALAAAAAVASIVPPAGGAATVSLGPLGPCCFRELPLHYDAEPGETNDVQIFMTVFGDSSPSGTWIVVDNSATITAGADCTSLDAHTAKCSEPPGSTELFLHAIVNLGDMDDSLHSESACGTLIIPEEGLCGVTADGGDGADRLYSPNVGYGFMNGGTGADGLLAGSKNAWDPYCNSSELHGGAGNDQLAGRGRPDELFGGDGKDVVRGGRGRDVIQGGPGNDELWARDGFKDVVRGGSGSNRARRDVGLDVLHSIEAFF
jgi:serralysin